MRLIAGFKLDGNHSEKAHSFCGILWEMKTENAWKNWNIDII
jgi:hypothetical protein